MKRLSLLVAVLATLCLAQAEPQEPVEVPQIAKFKLDLISGSEGDPTSGWWSITGGESNFEWVDFTESPDPQEQPSGQFWTFKLITTDLEDPPFNISGYETVTIDLGPAPIFQSFLMLLDPLNRIVYYPSGIVPPGDDVRSYAGIVLGTYKTSGDDPSGGGFVYITNLLTNNVSVWDSNPDHFVIAIDVGAGPIGITASDNPAHIAQTVLDEAIMVQGVNPDDNCELSCEENQTNCRRRVRVERKECRAKCRFDPDPRPCLRDCLITAREAMRQCKKQVAQICAESCSLSLKQVESFYLGEKEESLTAFTSAASFNIDAGRLFDKTILNIMERKGQVEMDYAELLSFEDLKNFVLERDYEDESDWEDWYEMVRDGKMEYRPITLNYHDTAGDGRIIYGLALPIWYEKILAPPDEAPGPARETIELLVERIEYK